MMKTMSTGTGSTGTVTTNANGYKICKSTFLCHVAVALILVLSMSEVTAITKRTFTSTRSKSTGDSSQSDSMLPIYTTTDSRRSSSNVTSSLFAPNDPYRWKEQLIQKQKLSSHRQLDVEYRSVLVVRIVTGSDSDGSTIEREINNVLFYESTQITVQRQMQLCSGGRILLQPSNDGIITVQMNNLGTSQVEPYTLAAAEKVMKDHYHSTDTLIGYKEQLRKMADHVLIILPESFPANTFVANAEIGRPICVFSYQWLSSLSAYMHEMGHNLHLRHSGKGSSEPYGDNTGYMGVSNPKAYGPQKCYNAAQHWSLNFYENQRLSLLNINLSSAPVLLQLAAFVDHDKVGSDYTVLVQASSNIYFHFNRAKAYNAGTEMLIDQVVVINDGGEKTILIAGLDATSSALHLSSLVIKVCSINIGAESGIDFAVVAVATSDNGRMCDGAILSSASSVVETPSPTNPPIAITSAPVPIPTSVPTISPSTYAPSTYEPTVATPPPVTPSPVTTTSSTTNPPTSLPTEYYVSSPNPTDQEEKRGNNQQDDFNPVVIKTPIFISSAVDNDDSGGEVVRSSSKASSSGRSPAFLPGILVLVGVMIVTVLVTMRRMAIHRYYSSKPLPTRDDDTDNKSGSSSTFIEDIEVSTNGFMSNVNNLLRDYEIDLGGDDNNSATTKKKNRR